MRRYQVVLPGKTWAVKAGNARTAINRAMYGEPEANFRPAATIVVHDLGPVNYVYRIFADVPDEGGGYTRKDVTPENRPYGTKRQAEDVARGLDGIYRFVSVTKVEGSLSGLQHTFSAVREKK